MKDQKNSVVKPEIAYTGYCPHCKSHQRVWYAFKLGDVGTCDGCHVAYIKATRAFLRGWREISVKDSIIYEKCSWM